MHIDLMRDRARNLPAFSQPLEVQSMRIWHCKYDSLDGTRVLRNLEILVIATWPDQTFDTLRYLKNLTYLSILHLPHVTDLSPLAMLVNLQSLSLSTLPSWDASGRRTTVESLEPICRLPKLRHLELFGVVPKDKSLSPLHSIKTLETARFSKFPREEIDRFYETSRVLNKSVPEPNFSGA